MASKSIITHIQAQAARLIEQHEKLRAEYALLLQQRDALRAEARQREAQIRELKAEVERLRLAESLSGNTSDSTKSRARINRLLREVDKCIALLTNVQQS